MISHDSRSRARTAVQGDAGRHRSHAGQQSPYRDTFAFREFAGLWSAQVLSSAGDQLAQVAIAVGVYERTRSPLLTVLIYAVGIAAQLTGGPLLAEVAGLYTQRSLMIGLALGRAGLVTVMATARLPFAGLCALLVTAVMLGGPFADTRSGLMPWILPAGQQDAGAEISSFSCRAGQVLGFLAGGVAVALLRPSGALLLDAMVFLAAAGLVGSWVIMRPLPPRRAPRPLLLPVTRPEAAAVLREPVPRALLIFTWLASCAVVPEALAAPYARELHGGRLATGLLLAAIPAGAVAGAAAFALVARPADRLRLMSWLPIVCCAPLTGTLLHPPLWAVTASWAVAGAGGAYQLAATAAFIRTVPAASRTRAVDLAQSGFAAVQVVGLVLAGLTAELIGPRAVIAVTGLFGVAVATTLGRSWRRLTGQLPPVRHYRALAPDQGSRGRRARPNS
ncbi:MAG: MFS transporter [Actinomycetota bacterium]